MQCVERDNECAAACEATVRMLVQVGATDQNVWQSQLQACADACAACAEECARHADMHEHCALCAESCRKTERACRTAEQLVGTMAAAYSMS